MKVKFSNEIYPDFPNYLYIKHRLLFFLETRISYLVVISSSYFLSCVKLENEPCEYDNYHWIKRYKPKRTFNIYQIPERIFHLIFLCISSTTNTFHVFVDENKMIIYFQFPSCRNTFLALTTYYNLSPIFNKEPNIFFLFLILHVTFLCLWKTMHHT